MSETEKNAGAPAAAALPAWMQLVFLALAGLMTFFVVMSYQRRERRNEDIPIVSAIPSFSLTNQDGQKFGLNELSGEVWVAGFIFTRCSGPCPMVSAAMAALQQDPGLAELKILSISVDPEHDSPQILKDYANNFRADTQRWQLLTGPKESVYELIHKGFKLAVQEAPAEMNVPIGERYSHSSRLVLIDRQGRIRGYYESTDGPAMLRLRKDAGQLLRQTQK